MSNTVSKNSAGAAAASLYAPSGGRKYLNAAERQRLLTVIATLPPRRALFALTLARAGARVSEALALRFASFQIETGVVALPTLTRRRHCVREVPLPPELMQALDREYAIAAHHRDPEGCNLRPWPWPRTTAWRLVKDIMQQAGVSGVTACPRGFRHGLGVGALQCGVPINLVQRPAQHHGHLCRGEQAGGAGDRGALLAGHKAGPSMARIFAASEW